MVVVDRERSALSLGVPHKSSHMLHCTMTIDPTRYDMSDRKCAYIVAACVALGFALIGTLTYVYGCDPHLAMSCVKYDAFTSRASNYSCEYGMFCQAGMRGIYHCWRCSVELQGTHHIGQHCTIAGAPYDHMNDALNDIQNAYPLDTIHDVYRAHNGSCASARTLSIIAIIGVVFLVLAGTIILLIIIDRHCNRSNDIPYHSLVI